MSRGLPPDEDTKLLIIQALGTGHGSVRNHVYTTYRDAHKIINIYLSKSINPFPKRLWLVNLYFYGRPCFSKNGFSEVRRRGSHIVMQRKLAQGTITVPVPDHNEIRIGTLQSIIRQSGVPKHEFES